MPNIVRRFLENYCGLRYPDGKSAKGKYSRFITDDTKRMQVTKLINEYSHNRSADRALRFPEIAECRSVVSVVLEAIESHDKDHYDSLCSSCN